MPSGGEKCFVSEYCGSITARFMNSAQIGAAAVAASELHVGVIVVTDPYNADKIAGVSCKPCIVRRARLSRGGLLESATPNLVTVSKVDYASIRLVVR